MEDAIFKTTNYRHMLSQLETTHSKVDLENSTPKIFVPVHDYKFGGITGPHVLHSFVYLDTWTQRSPRMVPGSEACGLVAPINLRPYLITPCPSQT